MSGGRAITPQVAAARRHPSPDMSAFRLALPRPDTRPRLLESLLGPFRRMVAWDEPWDVETDEDDAA